MINVESTIDITVNFPKKYTVNGHTLIDEDGVEITFKSYPSMAKYLGITKQGLYYKLKKITTR